MSEGLQLYDPEGRRLYLTSTERDAFLAAARQANRTHRVRRPVLHRLPDIGGPGIDAAPYRHQRLDNHFREPQETPQGHL